MTSYKQIQLSPEKFEEAKKFGGGPDWHEKIRNAFRVDIYIEQNLNLLKGLSSYGGWNCCTTGSEMYVRKDGQPITTDDLEAMKALEKGQENSVTVAPDGMSVTHKWLCDSSG